MLKIQFIALLPCLLLVACISDESSSSGKLDLSDLRSYNPDSDYAEQLATCASAYQQNLECKIGTLPPLSADSSDEPTVDEIMDRVVVSHQWMGDNFRAALTEQLLPIEIRKMMRPLAAIVIDDDIRPSFFLSGSGMIYLDPKYLWLTSDEKSTISEVQDFRSAFAPQMTALPAWRYLNGDEYAYPSNDSTSRSATEMSYSLARLLFHELAHANDFIELERLPSLSPEAGFSSLLNPEGGQMSEHVQASHPLQSSTLLNYAAALYLGEPASEFTKSLSGINAGAHRNSEGANATYNYTTRYEDFAMLVEETMMLRHFGFRRDTAFVEQEVTGTDSSGEALTDYVVYWGQRGRIGDTLVRPRAQMAMEKLLPDISWGSFFDSLAEPSEMAVGATWLDNLDLTAGTDNDLSLDAEAISERSQAQDFYGPHD